VTHENIEIHAISSDKAVYFFLGRKSHGVEYQTLCGSEVTRKVKQLELEEGTSRAPVPYSWRRQWVNS